MTTYYVATLARYVLVEAENEAEARERGYAALHELNADLREGLGRDVPINILTVRPARPDDNPVSVAEPWYIQCASRLSPPANY